MGKNVIWVSSRFVLAWAGLFAFAADPAALAREPGATPVRAAMAAEASADECLGFQKNEIEKGVEYVV